MNKNDKKREQEKAEKSIPSVPLPVVAQTEARMADEKQQAVEASGSMGSEARIQALQSEVERLRGELSLVRSQERADLQRDIDSAREAATAFRADLVALDEVARGGAGVNMPITTELGQHLLKSVQDLIRVIDMRREQALADATPEAAWSSPRAKELVEKVPPNEREPLLGDLLADLALLAGESGKNESAQDVLKRRVFEASELRLELESARTRYETLARHLRAAQEEVSELKAAMVAKRSPDASAAVLLEQIGMALTDPAAKLGIALDKPFPGPMVEILSQVLREWSGLREMLGAKPMTAVAVRDDSTPALSERYALLALHWDGSKLDVQMVDGPAMPWMDLARPMRHAVDTHLVPSTFR